MPTTPEGFTARLGLLRGDIGAQGRRVQSLIESAFDAAFALDPAAAARVIEMDEIIDRVDVDIERAAVQLLTDACAAGAALPPGELRLVLTVVKVNNELERIADLGVRVAESVQPLVRVAGPLPDTFRVMANSIVGILRDATLSVDRLAPELAKVVLASEDAIEEFKRALLREMQSRVAAGQLPVDVAFVLQEIADCCQSMADHCSNIAEQVVYVASGAIVRHMHGHWQEYRPADLGPLPAP